MAASTSNTPTAEVDQAAAVVPTQIEGRQDPSDEAEKKPWKNLSLMMVMTSLACSTFLSALDLTVVSTALPTIANDLHLNSFVWVGSAYALASTVVLPLTGSLANTLGRRDTLVAALVLFTVGSALCGSAKGQSVLIAGRTVQGLGGGGILSLTDILITDLFPLKVRGQVYGLIGGVWAVASAVGPPVGGALSDANWRWIWYMNLPLCGISLILVIVFCKFTFPTVPLSEKVKNFDFTGNMLFIAGSTAVVLGLSWGGQPYDWASAAVLVPLLVGFALVCLFFWVERFARQPTVPLQLLSNRTSFSGYATVCVHSIATMPLLYYLPIYFQVVKQTSAVKSGVNVLPLSLVMAVFAIIAGFICGYTKTYKALNIICWAMTIVGFGLLCLLKVDSGAGIWAGLPVVAGTFLGMLFNCTLYPVAAPLPVELGAPMMAFYGFAQNFGQVLGITVGAVILSNDLPGRLPESVREQVSAESDLAYALIPVISQLPEDLQAQVKMAVNDSLRVIWITCAGLSGLGLALSLLMKDLPLGDETDERFGLREEEEESKDAQPNA